MRERLAVRLHVLVAELLRDGLALRLRLRVALELAVAAARGGAYAHCSPAVTSCPPT